MFVQHVLRVCFFQRLYPHTTVIMVGCKCTYPSRLKASEDKHVTAGRINRGVLCVELLTQTKLLRISEDFWYWE